MAKLSEITRKENCFITSDGYMLRNMKDMYDYFCSCSEEAFAVHANYQKNDFANWTYNVLLCPKLAKILSDSKSLGEAREGTRNFLENFDYSSRSVPQEKAFITVDGFSLKSIHELYYYINNCADEGFNYHCNNDKNDFANWVNDVLSFPALASKLRSNSTREGLTSVFKDFLLNSASDLDPEYQKYITDHMLHPMNSTQQPGAVSNEQAQSQYADNVQSKTDQADSGKSNPSSSSNQTYEQSTSQENKVHNEDIATQKEEMLGSQTKTGDSKQGEKEENTSKEDDGKKEERSGKKEERTDDSNNDQSETIDLKPLNISHEEEEPEKKEEAKIDPTSFHQYSDDELEKFTSFIHTEKQNDSDTKTEYLKAVLNELKNMIKELRRVEKDPFIADLMLRNISAKVDYYALSHNPDDYNHIIRLMKEAQNEIEECLTHSTYNLADEIFKDLKLTGVILKKA